MQHPPTRRLLPLLLTAAAFACSGPSQPGDSPGGTLDQFYRDLNAGDFAGAMAAYSSEALDVWEDPGLTQDTSFADWARSETRGGTVDSVRILDEQRANSADQTDVQFEVLYADGSTARHKVRVVLEDGRWRMGLVR